MTFEIPKIRAKAQYKSSGVLILVRASGAGDYWGEYGKLEIVHRFNYFEIIFDFFFIAEGVKAKIYFKAAPQMVHNGLTYLSIEKVKMDFSVKNIRMGVDNIANGNSVIRKFIFAILFLFFFFVIDFFLFLNFIEAALNLFINSNSQELLKEMKPSLRNKLTLVIKNFMDRLFDRIPLEHWLV